MACVIISDCKNEFWNTTGCLQDVHNPNIDTLGVNALNALNSFLVSFKHLSYVLSCSLCSPGSVCRISIYLTTFGLPSQFDPAPSRIVEVWISVWNISCKIITPDHLLSNYFCLVGKVFCWVSPSDLKFLVLLNM